MAEKLKILVATEAVRERVNGVKTVLLSHLEMFEQAGCEVQLVSPKSDIKEPLKVMSHWQLPSKRTDEDYYHVCLKLRMIDCGIIRRWIEWADVIYLHSLSVLTWHMLRLADELDCRDKVVLHLHTQTAEYADAKLRCIGLGWLAKLVVNALTKKAITMAGRVVVPSNHFHCHLQDQLGFEFPAVELPGVVSLPPQSRRAFREILGQSTVMAFPKFVCYSGRLVKAKNWQLLLDAMAEVTRNDSSVYLVVAGPVENQAKYQRYWNDTVGGGREGHLIFTGPLERDDLNTLFSRCHAGVSASDTETNGLAVLEQIWAGLPVVVLDDTPMADVIDRWGGGLISDGTISDFADQVTKILGDPGIRREIVINSCYFQMYYSLQTIGERLLEICEQTAAGAP